MKIRALESFSGAFSMYKGEVGECSDKAILQDLLQAGYVEEARAPEQMQKAEKPQKDVKSSGGKRDNKQRDS